MRRRDFAARYELLEGQAHAGVDTYKALDREGGPVFVHLIGESDCLPGGADFDLGSLLPEDADQILAVLDVRGAVVVISREEPALQPFVPWIRDALDRGRGIGRTSMEEAPPARPTPAAPGPPEPAPVSPPEPADADGPGVYTRLMRKSDIAGAVDPARPKPGPPASHPPPVAPPPPPSTPAPPPSDEGGVYTRLLRTTGETPAARPGGAGGLGDHLSGAPPASNLGYGGPPAAPPPPPPQRPATPLAHGSPPPPTRDRGSIDFNKADDYLSRLQGSAPDPTPSPGPAIPSAPPPAAPPPSSLPPPSGPSEYTMIVRGGGAPAGPLPPGPPPPFAPPAQARSPVAEADAPAPPRAKKRTWVIVGLVASVLLLAAVLAFVVLRAD